MDFVQLFDETPIGIHPDTSIMPDLDMANLGMTEDNFLNMLADDESAEDFGLTILENNQDMLDIMAPLMATPISSISTDDIELMGSLYSDSNSPDRIFNDLDGSYQDQEDVSPLRQLLLRKPNKIADIPETPPSRSSRPVRKRARRTRNTATTKRQTSSRNKNIERQISSENCSSESSDAILALQEEDLGVKDKPASKALKFPPCSVCGGNASGLHYGVNSCEACKGFFRRYIIRNEEYKCPKGGNCKVVNRNRENCSGCRLRKCLDLGMSKDNSKLGRYSLSRRTETIQKVNVLEGKLKSKKSKGNGSTNHFQFDHTYSEITSAKQILCLDDIVTNNCAPDELIEGLVKAMDEFQSYGPNISTKEDIEAQMRKHHLKYQSKLEVYGQMKAVPNDEYYKLLKEYGIDIDGRIKVFREYIMKMKRISKKYYDFATKIPGFSKLSPVDQSKLLNSSRCDFFVTLMHEGFSEDYNILLARNGAAYHVDELADKFFSRKLINALTLGYRRIQLLELTKEEKALLIAMTLVFTDRCKLENREFVDKMQYLVSELLRYQLERTSGPAASRRLARFVDCLIYLRDFSDIYWNEYKQLCKDEVIVEQVPMVTEFLVDEW